MLVAAMNPCNDVFLGSGNGVNCTELERRKYYSRLSRPLLDRIDLQIEVPAIKYQDITAGRQVSLRLKLKKGSRPPEKFQLERFRGRKIFANSQLGSKDLRQFCLIEAEGQRLLETAMKRFQFSARAYDRILKVARTIADLAGEEMLSAAAIAEAVQYRMLDIW